MTTNRLLPLFLSRLLALALALAGASAIAQTDPPARVASLSHIEGSVALAPAGDTEWTDAAVNRPITRGDRMWTDRGARAEVHLGSAVLHLDDQTFLDITALDQDVLQASLNEGSVNARVRALGAGENFEIDTPNLAFRAAQPGDYRIDVDPARGSTRVTVRGGIALVYGASGEAQQLQPGQQVTFAGRDLDRVAVQASPLEDGFDRWAADRNRREDESIAARYVPREVVGYQQLDPYGSWAQDPSYGAIWFPTIAVADWAPYRYGHWEWIAPWGWTWIDDAPWGFAPFHYGRWAMIGSRWAWVPGRIGPRPIYAPALVVFVGGSSRSDWHLRLGSDRGIAWYPLAPGEAWRPTYRASPLYVRNVNRNIVGSGSSFDGGHGHARRGDALTAVRVEDFSRGRPVNSRWSRVNPAEIARAPVATPQALPEPARPGAGGRGAQARTQPPAQVPGPVITGRPQPQFAPPGAQRGEPGDRGRADRRASDDPRLPPRGQDERRPLMQDPRGPARQPPPAADGRLQRGQDERPGLGRRGGDEQRREQAQVLQRQEQARRDQQVQRERQQDEQRGAQQGQIQRERAIQRQAAQEEQRAAQQEQLRQQRAIEQQQRAAQQQEQQQQRAVQRQRAAQQEQLRQQRAIEQQQRAAQQQEQQQQRAVQQQRAAQQEQLRQQRAIEQQQRAAQQQEQQQQRAVQQQRAAQQEQLRQQRAVQQQQRAEERARPAPEPRGEGRSQGGEDGRGRGRGHGVDG